MKIRIITTSRYSHEKFKESALAVSLGAYRRTFELALHAENKNGLGYVYDGSLLLSMHDDVLVFVHDDVAILEPEKLESQLSAAFERFDVVGVCGSNRRERLQDGWIDGARIAMVEKAAAGSVVVHRYHREDLSGTVIFNEPPSEARRRIEYGPSPAPVKLMDGLFIAVKVDAVKKAGVSFDPRFKWHFYDLDFCRSCEKAGLKMGTWPILVEHRSAGKILTPEWYGERSTYFRKWGE